MTLKEAAHTLYEHLGCGRYPHWVQAIGVRELGDCNGVESIVVYLVREPYPSETPVPTTWHDYPIESRVIGQIHIGPA